MPYDIMPARAALGGSNIMLSGVMDATGVLGQTLALSAGDLVFRNNDGEIQQFPADATAAVIADGDSGRICGVAAVPGVDPSTGTVLVNPRTGNLYATGDEILFYPADHQIIFKTKNMISAANTPVVPTGIMVGESFQLAYDNTAGVTKWCILTTAGGFGTDICAVIHGVLDSRGRRIPATDTTNGVWILFEIKTNA